MADALIKKGETRGEFVCIRGEKLWPSGILDISLWKKEGSDKLWLIDINDVFYETEELVINYLD